MATEITRSRIDWLSDLITAADDVWMASRALGVNAVISTEKDYSGTRLMIIMREVQHDTKAEG